MQKNKKTFKSLNLTEAKKDSIVLAWGRFNPPTTGHEKLINTVVAEARKRSADYRIYPTKTTDPKKNPLTFKEKVRFMRKMFPRHARKISSDEGVNTVIKAAQNLEKEGYKNLTIIAGSDRVQEFNTLLNKYNKKEYTFDKIDVVSAGERDPDAENVSGMSASKMRDAARVGDFTNFKKGVPNKNIAKPLYDAVRRGMQINEQFEEDGVFDYIEFLNEGDGVVSSRFNRLLRFGLSVLGHGDIPLVKRAFQDYEKAETNPLLRKKIFLTIDRVFDYLLTDTILYNRFLLLLHRKYLFGEGNNTMEFKDFKSNLLTEADGTTPLSTASDHPEKMNFVARFPSPEYTNSFIQDMVLLNLIDLNWKSGDGTEVQFFVRKSTSGQEAPSSSEDEILRQVDRMNRYSGHNTHQYGSEARIVDLVMKHGGKISRFEGDVREGINEEDDINNLVDEMLEGLLKKSWKSEVAYDILSEVYLRGLNSWEDDCNKKDSTTPDQWAYARVNSFVAGGKAQKENDFDLWNEHLQREEEPLSEMDEEFIAELGTVGKAAIAGIAYHLWKKSIDKKKKDKEDAAVVSEPEPEKKPEKTGWRSQVDWSKNEEAEINEEFENTFYSLDEKFEKEIFDEKKVDFWLPKIGNKPRETSKEDAALLKKMRKDSSTTGKTIKVKTPVRKLKKIDDDVNEAFELEFSEEHGAGFEGTNKLRKKYRKDTPGQDDGVDEGILGAVAKGTGKVIGGVAKGTIKLAGKGAVGAAKLAGKGVVGTAKLAGKGVVAGAKAVTPQRKLERATRQTDRAKAGLNREKAKQETIKVREKLKKEREKTRQLRIKTQKTTLQTSSFVPEESPPSAKAERFIKKNKESFKDKYGERWKEVLYATSWKMHNKHWNKE